ncbi:uncharacterized protein EV420DRAFT_877502 [Desarmillaria tabescens]|uniref:Uncharacterized protein n=1 Tax=Armillaria tabescens TaxID=1929756 RepID=A0AA39JRB0_ARMTA|nr:uncharacterized protein EV420DRAFT_877502 [Desarmillaria tabescens]KAK0447471.1 hypothetical protein EV420DRAFT_877502 [Desarmillaria tabescens]
MPVFPCLVSPFSAFLSAATRSLSVRKASCAFLAKSARRILPGRARRRRLLRWLQSSPIPTSEPYMGRFLASAAARAAALCWASSFAYSGVYFQTQVVMGCTGVYVFALFALFLLLDDGSGDGAGFWDAERFDGFYFVV